MARARRKKVEEKVLTGLKYFAKLGPLLKRLRPAGCERDTAGNRGLFYDQYCVLVLLYLLNPLVSSLRALQQASGLAKVQKTLGCSRASLGSLSEASHVFDPELLREIIAELAEQARPLARDPRLKDVKQLLTLVDGTLLSALPRMAQASLLKQRTGSAQVKWCLHTHFEVEKFVPTRIATNLLDVPAEIIALLYQYRWTIEIFFRMFKHLLGCRHLLSHHPDGIKIQTYCAIIACLLINLWTGRQPTKRTQEMLCFFLIGWATEDELLAHLATLKLADERAAAKKS